MYEDKAAFQTPAEMAAVCEGKAKLLTRFFGIPAGVEYLRLRGFSPPRVLEVLTGSRRGYGQDWGMV